MKRSLAELKFQLTLIDDFYHLFLTCRFSIMDISIFMAPDKVREYIPNNCEEEGDDKSLALLYDFNDWWTVV